jgi:hypothetical protein
MRIGINASFARKSNTGIGQVTINFLKELAKHKNENEYILYLEEDINFALPENFQKRIFLPLWKRDDLVRKIRWEKTILPRKAKKDKCDFFISLYQCPAVIQSAKHIMVVHDLIPKIFPEYLDNSRKKYYQALIDSRRSSLPRPAHCRKSEATPCFTPIRISPKTSRWL